MTCSLNSCHCHRFSVSISSGMADASSPHQATRLSKSGKLRRASASLHLKGTRAGCERRPNHLPRRRDSSSFHHQVLCVTTLPDGCRIVSGDEYGEARVWGCCEIARESPRGSVRQSAAVRRPPLPGGPGPSRAIASTPLNGRSGSRWLAGGGRGGRRRGVTVAPPRPRPIAGLAPD